jgi:DNA repair photolyase
MIISASRRTDIPAFYADWFINRVRAGYCTSPNPFNKDLISRVSLKPTDVEVIVFWTRNSKPLIKHLPELDDRGFRYYFQFTVMANPRILDPKSPPVEKAIRAFKTLSDCIGPARVIWRYDPIVLSNLTDSAFHREKFANIAAALKGYTKRAVISIVDIYKSIASRMRRLELAGLTLLPPEGNHLPEFVRSLVEIAASHDMNLVSCAEEADLQPYGVKPGKCVDDELIAELFGLTVTHKKDPNQREACGCVISKDIGVYDTCPFNCVYCYATHSLAAVQRNHAQHDPKSPSLVGWHDATPKIDAKSGTPGHYFSGIADE